MFKYMLPLVVTEHKYSVNSIYGSKDSPWEDKIEYEVWSADSRLVATFVRKDVAEAFAESHNSSRGTIKDIIKIFTDSDEIGCIYFPSCIRKLEENEIVVKLLGKDKMFKIIIEDYEDKE